MNRILSTLLVSAAVLLSGTVAFAVAAAITPPGVDGVDVVVTDRPVLSVAATSTQPPVAAVAASSIPVGRADKPAATATPTARTRKAVKGIVSGSEPKPIVVPAVKPKPPAASTDTNSDTDTDHEVVTPPVRDEDDDSHDSDDEPKSGSSSPSSDYNTTPSSQTIRHSGSKGD